MANQNQDQKDTTTNPETTPSFEDVKCEFYSVFKRNNYFPGKLLTASDFQMEQKYFINKHRLINRLVHGTGVLCGLEIVMNAKDLAPNHIRIQPGYALDACGREIELQEPVDIDVAQEVVGFDASTTSFMVLLCYKSCGAGTQPSITDTSGCSEKCCVSTVLETYRVAKSEILSKQKVDVTKNVLEEMYAVKERQMLPVEESVSVEEEKIVITVKKMLQEETVAFKNTLKNNFASCPDCPDCQNNGCCLSLAQIDYTADKTGITVKAVTDKRPFVYSNPLLFKLIEQLSRDGQELALELADEIDSLKKPVYPKIKNISWSHNYPCESVEDWIKQGQNGFEVEFTEPMRRETINRYNVSLQVELLRMLENTSEHAMKKALSKIELPIKIKEAEKAGTSAHTVWKFSVDSDASVFSDLYSASTLDKELHSTLLPLDLRIILQLKGDFIVSQNGNRCLDANFLRGTLPSGNDCEGGVFESWMSLALTPKNGLFAQYFTGAKEDFKACGIVPEVDFEDEQTTEKSALNYEVAKVQMVRTKSTRNFARFIGKIIPRYSEEYTFQVFTEGAATLYVGGKRLLHAGAPSGSTELTSDKITLDADQQIDIRLEYTNTKTTSTLQLSWSSETQTKEVVPQLCLNIPQGLFGEYFTGVEFNELKLVRVDGEVNFDWSKYPDANVNMPKENLAARWVGLISPELPGDYTFYLSSGDKSILKIDKTTIIDNSTGTAKEPELKSSKAIPLTVGKLYPIIIEYYKKQATAPIVLSWSSKTLNKQIVPSTSLSTPMEYTATATTPIKK